VLLSLSRANPVDHHFVISMQMKTQKNEYLHSVKTLFLFRY